MLGFAAASFETVQRLLAMVSRNACLSVYHPFLAMISHNACLPAHQTVLAMAMISHSAYSNVIWSSQLASNIAYVLSPQCI